MKTFFISMLFLLAGVCLCGCKSQKDYLYLADMTDEQGYAITQRYQPVVQRDDKLYITVSCKNPELAVPFNVIPGTYGASDAGKTPSQSQTAEKQYYRVDNNGDINFPVFGRLQVTGMTLPEVAEMIRDKIIKGNYIKDPIVTVEFTNFHYTVLGAAVKNGTFTSDGDRITILEAIARAGDLADNADLGKIAVIREDGFTRKIHTVDIRSSDLFNSPVFYLAQNDIIYVRPKKPKSQEKTNFLQWLTVSLSVVTAASTIIWATK